VEFLFLQVDSIPYKDFCWRKSCMPNLETMICALHSLNLETIPSDDRWKYTSCRRSRRWVYLCSGVEENELLVNLHSDCHIELGYDIYEVQTINGHKKIREPLSPTMINIGDIRLSLNTVDQKLLSNALWKTMPTRIQLSA
jgi:hypothetical protein